MAIQWIFIPQESFDNAWYMAYPFPHVPNSDYLEGYSYDMYPSDQDNFYLVSPRNYPFVANTDFGDYLSNWGECALTFNIKNSILESGITAQAEFCRCSGYSNTVIESSGLKDFNTLTEGAVCSWTDTHTFSTGAVTDRVAVHVQLINTSGSIKHYRFQVGSDGSGGYHSYFMIQFPTSLVVKKRMGIRVV